MFSMIFENIIVQKLQYNLAYLEILEKENLFGNPQLVIHPQNKFD